MCLSFPGFCSHYCPCGPAVIVSYSYWRSGQCKSIGPWLICVWKLLKHWCFYIICIEWAQPQHIYLEFFTFLCPQQVYHCLDIYAVKSEPSSNIAFLLPRKNEGHTPKTEASGNRPLVTDRGQGPFTPLFFPSHSGWRLLFLRACFVALFGRSHYCWLIHMQKSRWSPG